MARPETRAELYLASLTFRLCTVMSTINDKPGHK